MDSYEKVIKQIGVLIKRAQTQGIQIAQMDGPDSCTLDQITLDKDDLYIPQHLLTGWNANNVFYPPLQQGDLVLLQRVNEEKYAIIERVI